MSRSINPVPQFFDGSGDPVVSGKMFYFDSGTTTQKTTYADSALTIANTHPVLLDGSGRLPNVFFNGTAKQILTSSDDVQLWERDPVGGDTGVTFGADWNATQTYDIEAVVIGSDGEYYRSLVNSNSNNDPTTSAASWEQIEFERIFNVNVTYALGDRAIGSDGLIYTSLIGGNLNNNPVSDAVSWGTGVNDSRSDRLLTQSFIAGLSPSNAADADHDITISAGECADSGNAVRLVLTSAITKQIDASWAVGDDLGGLFSGTVAADTTYHLFVIEKDSDGSLDAGFDTSLTAANIPAGYTEHRRVASFLTDASANLEAFSSTEVGGGALRVILTDRIVDVNDSDPGTTANLATLSVPLGLQFIAHLSAALSDESTTDVIITSTSETDVPSISGLRDLRVNVNGQQATTNLDRMTDLSGQIRYRSTVGAALIIFTITLLSYTDFRR